MIASESISLRLTPQDRDLIDLAAEAARKSRTEFMLDSARAAATDTLLDRRMFMLSPAEFRAMERTIDAAPTAASVLADLKQRPSPWKR